MQRKLFLGSLFGAGILPFSSAKAKAFFTDRAKAGILVRGGEDRYKGETHFGGGEPNNLIVGSRDTDGDLCIFEASAQQKIGPPMHIHHHQDEWFFVVEGEYRIQVGNDVFDLKKGDSVFAPRAIPHAFVSTTSGLSRILCGFQPAGKMEAFFQELGKLQGIPDRAAMQKLFIDHDMQIVGPPLAV